MNRQPNRMDITNEREEKLKKKYGYSTILAFNPEFLTEYGEKIIASLPIDKSDAIKAKFNSISEFIVADRLQSGHNSMCCTPDSIHMDSSFFDVSDNSFAIKEGNEYVETLFIHELLLAASRSNARNKRNAVGIVEYERDEKGRITNSKKTGLNAGITRYLAEKISNQPVPAEVDEYHFGKQLVYLLSNYVSEETLIDAFINNDDTKLREAIHPELYDEIVQSLDVINKLDNSIRKIKNGQIRPKDPNSLVRLETVSKARKEQLVEKVFADLILPDVQRKFTSNGERQDFLHSLVSNNMDILASVSKYVPALLTNANGNFFNYSDARIAEIRSEIANNGINFEKIVEASKKVRDGDAIGPRVASNFIKAVDGFYDENVDDLNRDISTELTPLLRRELTGFVDMLENIEALGDPQTTESYKQFLRAYFHKVANLDEVIEEIKREKEQKKEESSLSEDGASREASATSQSEEDILEQIRKAGMEQARHDAVSPSPNLDDPLAQVRQAGMDQATRDARGDDSQNNKREPNLKTEFVVDDVVGEIIDQRGASMYDKAVNIARATGEEVKLDDEVIVDAQSKAVKNFLSTLPAKPSPRLQQLYGDSWKDVIAKAYEEGYKAGMAMQMQKATKDGLEQRKKEVEAIAHGDTLKVSQRPVSIEELQFAHENFEITPSSDGKMEVHDRVTGQKVVSEKTKLTVTFASEWVKVATPQVAFSKEGKETYALLQSQAKKDLQKEGAINTDELSVNADALGNTATTITTNLLQSSNDLVDQYFRTQTPDAKDRPKTQGTASQPTPQGPTR